MGILSWILILVAIGVVISIVVWIADHIEGVIWTVAGIAMAGIIFWLIQDHEDVFMLLAEFFLGGLLVLAVGYMICHAGNSVLSSSKNYMKAKSDDHLHHTEDELMQALNGAAAKKDIGYVTMLQMQEIFSGYANKSYPDGRSFSDIAMKFVNDCERQNFTNNKTWAEPYVQHIVQLQGRSLQQLLQEVDGPLKRFMHFTADELLLSQALNEYCQRKGPDAPPILTQTPLNGTTFYRPTQYGVRLYSQAVQALGQVEKEDIDFNDL